MMAARRIRLVLVALALCGTAASARADDDAGTLSPFAEGAGNRALALGSAYAAIGGDASAIVWNPAGLGGVSRLELMLSHFSLQHDAQETFAAFALPSWRWGTLGVGLRHFSVGGIEGRDTRNVLTNSDLVDSEDEFALGWGVGVGAWNLGTSVRVQRQSLAGFEDNGLGADLGVNVRPLALVGSTAAPDALTLGFAVRNVLRPSLRLDRDAVPDPTRIRAGLAWRALWGLVSADLEGGQGTALRPRAGFEWQPHGLFALRTGMNGGTYTAGLGLKWQNLTLDYAYQDGEITPMHRIGISLAHGRTVAESRTLALQREEDGIRARVAEGFRELEERRVLELVASVRSLLDEQRAAEALDVIATIATLRPDHPEINALETRALVETATALERHGSFAEAAAAYRRALERTPADSAAARGERRARAESDARAARTRELHTIFAGAMDAFAAGNLPEARRGLLLVIAAAPRDTEATEMLLRVERSCAMRAEDLLRSAREAIAVGRFDEAARRLEEARALALDSPAMSSVASALVGARARALAAARTPAQGKSEAGLGRGQTVRAFADLSPEKRRKLDDLYRRGLDALAARRSDDAIRYWELVRSAARDYPRVSANLVQEYLRRGLDEFASDRPEEAVNEWRKALAIDPSDSRTQGYLERAQRQLSRRRELLGGP